ncbi:hypothetical protein B0T22DRAFT_506577 [Podospora appendiculata]|uniref:Uncharacterized protein n=1 Tax=Podospora appendiculata TaxID=314037 RepID=A0AAE0XJ43_9PEZI|nr:hypothetical protein B0T22DRAFT_506577 [Podospora appendiculata]
MSSPGQIAEPKARPVSGLPATLSNAHQGRGAFKEYGQEYQFAETWENPPPELVVGGRDTRPVLGASQGDGSQEANAENHEPTHSLGGSSKGSVFRGSALWVPPSERKWYKRIPKMWWMIGIISVIGTTGVILAILGAMNVLGGHTVQHANSFKYVGCISFEQWNNQFFYRLRVVDSLQTLPYSSFLPYLLGTSLQQTHPIPCSNTSSYFTTIDWVGIAGGYHDTYDHADSAEDCCNICFAKDPGCAAWLYNATSPYTPCTQVLIDAEQPNPDSKCPKGYISLATFSHGLDAIAGLGPCGLKAVGCLLLLVH